MAKSFVHISNKLKASESKKSQGRGHKSNCMSKPVKTRMKRLSFSKAAQYITSKHWQNSFF